MEDARGGPSRAAAPPPPRPESPWDEETRAGEEADDDRGFHRTRPQALVPLPSYEFDLSSSFVDVALRRGETRPDLVLRLEEGRLVVFRADRATGAADPANVVASVKLPP